VRRAGRFRHIESQAQTQIQIMKNGLSLSDSITGRDSPNCFDQRSQRTRSS
jgi:hypothetical protein